MSIHFTKSQIALGLAGAVTTFIVGGLAMHSRAVPVPTPSASVQPLWVEPVADVPVPFAVRTPDRQGGPRAACRQDVQRLCGDLTAGGGRIVQCLAQRRSEVSQGCRAAIQQRRMERQQQRQSMRDRRQTNGAGYAHASAGAQPSARIITVPDAPSSSIQE